MTNKILLAAIALGLWANAAASYVRPARAQGETSSLTDAVGMILHHLDNLDVRTQDIQTNVVRLLVDKPAPAQCADK